MTVKLIEPTLCYKNSYNEYLKELGSEERYPYPLDLEHADFPALIARLKGYSKGQNLPLGFVPNTTFWLIKDEEIIACSHLRHRLNDELKHAGGHIGLGVRPSMRAKGFGKILILSTIDKAKQMGIRQVHIHCYESNRCSRALLLSIGARLLSSLDIEGKQDKVLRFVIDA